MPDDSATLDVKLQRNDYANSGEEFILKANQVDQAHSNSLVTKSVLSAAGDIAGKDVDLGTINYTLNGSIQAAETDTYPSYVSIDTTTWKTATEKEMNLERAMESWGPDASDGFDDLIWGPRTIPGMMSKYTVSENLNQKAPEQYDYTIEWTHANVYIGD
jgi:hypothetical protein